MKISLLLNSREKNRQNLGNLDEYLEGVVRSISTSRNIEVIIKYDLDDDIGLSVAETMQKKYRDILIKYFQSNRVGYGGQHIGYSECFKYVDNDSTCVFPMPDDIFFIQGTKWDLELMEHAKKYPDNIFLSKAANLLDFTDIIMFSRKLIELIGFGPKFAVDQWGHAFCKIFYELGIQDRVLCTSERARRRGCALDHIGMSPEATERWTGPRQDMLDYLTTKEYADIIDKNKNKIKTYLKL